jgi:hypothetical protein
MIADTLDAGRHRNRAQAQGRGRVQRHRRGAGRVDATEILAACNRVRGTRHFLVPECARTYRSGTAAL